MGNQKSQFEQRFSNNYAFIQAFQDPIHGFVKIYRKKFENYHYVMVIDRRLEQFNNRTFMTDCIKPRSLHKNTSSPFPPKLLAKNKEDTLMEYNSIKLQKLKRTLELIKRYQDDLMVPFFSYQVVNGSKLQCTEPVIQLYVEFQNHRLFEYLEVLRCKQLPLKTKEIIYILKSICQGITHLQKMEIEVTPKQMNIHNIFISNQGEIKINPIQILTRKEHERENIQNIESLKQESFTNPHIEMKKIALGKSLRSSSSAGDKKSSDERNSNAGTNYLRERNILFSSNESSNGNVGKLLNHREILRKLLIELSAFSLLRNSESKDLQGLSMIISRSGSVSEIGSNLQKYGSPCLEGLLVERIYDLDENVKNGDGNVGNKEGLSTSGLSNGQLSSNSEPIKNQTLTKGQSQRGLAKNQQYKGTDKVQPLSSVNQTWNNNSAVQNTNYISRAEYPNARIDSNKSLVGNAVGEHVEQRGNGLRNVLMEKRSEPVQGNYQSVQINYQSVQGNYQSFQGNYQNVVRMSQYSQGDQPLVSLTPNQYPIEKNNTAIRQLQPPQIHAGMTGRNVAINKQGQDLKELIRER